MKLNIFSASGETRVVVTIKALRDIYASGWVNGCNDDCYEDDSDTDIECEVVDYVESQH